MVDVVGSIVRSQSHGCIHGSRRYVLSTLFLRYIISRNHGESVCCAMCDSFHVMSATVDIVTGSPCYSQPEDMKSQSPQMIFISMYSPYCTDFHATCAGLSVLGRTSTALSGANRLKGTQCNSRYCLSSVYCLPSVSGACKALSRDSHM
jgi:hypothetical protein